MSGISKSPAIFDPEKLRYINAEYIRELSTEEYKAYAEPIIKQSVKRAVDIDVLCAALQPRTEIFSDISARLTFIDELPEYSNELYFNKKMKTDADTAKQALSALLPVLEGIGEWNAPGVHEALFALIEKLGVKNGWLLWPLRVALCGEPVSPGGGIELAAMLGKEETIARVKKGLAQL